MKQVASDGTRFYSDLVVSGSPCNSTANSITEIVSIFKAIAVSFKGTRLVSDKMT